MTDVLQITGQGYLDFDSTLLGGTHSDLYLSFDLYWPTASFDAWDFGSGFFGDVFAFVQGSVVASMYFDTGLQWFYDQSPYPAIGGIGDGTSPDTWHTIQAHYVASTPGTPAVKIDGVDNGFISGNTWTNTPNEVYIGNTIETEAVPIYLRNVKIGTGSWGASNIVDDDLSTGGDPDWYSGAGDFAIAADPFVPPPPPAGPGRVMIAWDDGPLEPNPTWTAIDQATNGFPDQFVSGYDIKVGRQTLLSQTDTGTATVYCNDREGLFDDRNLSSPYQDKLSGRQIMLQLWNPVTEVWEPQFRGLIDDYSYDIDGSASDANGDPINASVQISCVDLFDYLNGFGLTPGLAGVTPPAGAEDGVYYAATAGTVDDRIIEILTDAGVDPDMYGSPGLASGNVKLMAAKYDPGESALTAIRDAVDAEFPFIGVCYCDRRGKFQMRGRYGRFEPDVVSSEPGSEWDFTRWAVGDQTAIIADPTRAQMRVLSFSRSRAELINVAICYPQNLPASQMPATGPTGGNQVFADVSSITAYGQHAAPPMSDLLTADYAGPGTITPDDGKTQCFLYAKLLVKNKAFPRESITALQVKAINPEDDRAPETWSFITRSDLSHIVNVRVGYPGGTGFTGDSPRDDYYIEGRQLVVRPLNPTHDYVEYNVEVTPAIWSMDTHGVFPTIEGAPPSDTLFADFSYAQ